MTTNKLSMTTLLLVLSFGLSIVSAQAIDPKKSFRLAPLITDNMVLQQQSDVPLWGWGTPGTEVRLQASWGKTAATRVKPDSSWTLKVQSPKAGGPHQLVFSHADGAVTITNVLSGEVWLCSGQSNMEMPLAGWPPKDTIMNSANEIARSANTDIRVYTVTRAYSSFPESACNGRWVESSPETSPGFSATAYFFAKKLHETLHVPIGLIHTSWGGTAVHSWIGAKYLSRAEQFDTTLQKLRFAADGQRRFKEWLTQFPVVSVASKKGEAKWKELSFGDAECSSRAYDDAAWRTMKLPVLWERTETGNLDGVVWFRKQVTIQSEWVGKALVLELGPIDDMDATYVNGVKVGGYETAGFWNTNRVYTVPASALNDTNVVIAVRVIDNQGGGGIYGAPASMSLRPEGSESRVSLAGDWKYLPVALYANDMFFVFGQTNQYDARPRLPIDLTAFTPTALYNAMLAPLVPYTIRGAIWYQGESDAGNPKQYRQLFPLMIENWRNDFGVGDFPFYYVQIAPYDYGAGTNSAKLREVQTATLAVKNTGMAVTLDITDFKNIHPANKQDVGGRLALWALAKTYGKNLTYSGPLYSSMKKGKGVIELLFEHAENGLVIKSGNSFQIAGADRVFKDAIIEAKGNRLIVSHPDIAEPQAVRYAFSNMPEASLFNKEGLPAPSFRTDDWE